MQPQLVAEVTLYPTGGRTGPITCRACRDCGGSILSFIPRKMVQFAPWNYRRANEPCRSVKQAVWPKRIHCSVWRGRCPHGKSSQFSEANYSVDKDILHKLEQRLGPIHARQRLG